MAIPRTKKEIAEYEAEIDRQWEQAFENGSITEKQYLARFDDDEKASEETDEDEGDEEEDEED